MDKRIEMPVRLDNYLQLSNLLIIHQIKTKKITLTVTEEVWIPRVCNCKDSRICCSLKS